MRDRRAVSTSWGALVPQEGEMHGVRSTHLGAPEPHRIASRSRLGGDGAGSRGAQGSAGPGLGAMRTPDRCRGEGDWCPCHAC